MTVNREDIFDEAARWVARHNSDELTAEDRQAFGAWIAQDPAHRDAYTEAGALWAEMTPLAARMLNEIQVESPSEPVKIRLSRYEMERQNRHRLAGWRAMAATVFVVVAGAIAALQWLAAPEIYRTATGEDIKLVLDDGSHVHVGARTEIKVAYQSKSREIDLAGGEAYFNVAHDKKRPFLVKTPEMTVVAVGTAFNVLKLSDLTDVTVTEGVVEVTTTEGGVTIVRRVAAGQHIAYRPEEGLSKITKADINSATAWQDGMLVYEDALLGDVLANIKRYLDTNIAVSDPKLAQMKVTGAIRIDDKDGIIPMLEAAFSLKAVKQADVTILVRANSRSI